MIDCTVEVIDFSRRSYVHSPYSLTSAKPLTPGTPGTPSRGQSGARGWARIASQAGEGLVTRTLPPEIINLQ